MKITHAIAYLSRLLLGIVFVFSGFVKAVDPLGTAYKLSDYMTALGMADSLQHEHYVFLSVMLSASEFALGMCVLLDFWKRKSIMLCLGAIFIFTLFTFWIAIVNPVSDCGCFGDAVVLTNWQTFVKNVMLFFLALHLYFHHHIPVVHIRKMYNIYPVLFICCPILISAYSLYNLPLLDFRPYYIGANIKEGMSIPENSKKAEYVTHFIMEKNGKQKIFGLHDYPDTTWKLIETKVDEVSKGYQPLIRDFYIKKPEDKSDITDEILSAKVVYLMIMPYVENASQKNIVHFNKLYQEAVLNGVDFYAVTASSCDNITEWKNKTNAQYPFLLMNETTLKTIIRSSPGLVLIKNGVVINKWSHNFLPKSLSGL